MTDPLNLPKILYQITGTFEYELLIELLLRHWQHPLADDEQFRNAIIEDAAVILRESASGVRYGNLPPNEVNLVFAVCHVESLFVANAGEGESRELREKWLSRIRQALPSCFSPQDLLGGC